MNLTKKFFHQKMRLDLNYHFMKKKSRVPGKKSRVPGQKLKNHPILEVFGPKRGSGGEFDEKIFSSKDAPGPKLSFYEKKVTRTREKVTRTGPKTTFFNLYGPKRGAGVNLTEKIFSPKDAPGPKL